MSKDSGPKPWLSVIIPTLNEVDNLPRCLERLRGVLPTGELEIIVADGGSTDGTIAAVANEPCLRTYHCTRTSTTLGINASSGGRAQQLNEGAQLARGQYLWFLHADTLPPQDWAQHLDKARRQKFPACFSVRFSRQENSRLLRFYARGSHWNHWLVRFGDQSLFVSRTAFERSGGYLADHQLMEGHEIAKRLRRQAGGFLLLPASVMTSSRRYRQHGVVFTQSVFVLIFGLYYLGVGQERLSRIYRWAF